MTSYPTDPSPSRGSFATAPAWSMLATLAGGLVGVNLIPTEQYWTPGALVPAAMALVAGFLAGPLIAAVRSPIALARTEHMLAFGVCYWLLLDVVLGQARVAGVPYTALVSTFWGIVLFVLALWAGSAAGAFTRWGAPVSGATTSSDVGPRFLFAAAMVSGVLGLARVVVGCKLNPQCVIDAFYQPRFSAAWFHIDAFGHLDTLFLYSRYFGFLVLPLTVALMCQEGRLTRRSAAALALGMLCLVLMIGDGGRKDVGTIAGACFLTWALMKHRLRLRHLLVFGVGAAALVFLMQFMLVAREIGIAAAIEQNVLLERKSAPVGTVDRNFRFFSHIVYLIPDRIPHNGMQGVAYATTLWIPGGFVPREWQRRSLSLPVMLNMSVGPGYSWTCSAICDLYMIGGLPAIAIGGFLFGLASRSAVRLLAGSGSAHRPVLYALLTMTLFLSLRALHEVFVTGLIVLAFMVLVWARESMLKKGGAPLPANSPVRGSRSTGA